MKICFVHPVGVNVQNCHKWFDKLKDSDLDLLDEYRSQRPTVPKNVALKTTTEKDSCQNMYLRELVNLGPLCKIISSRLGKCPEKFLMRCHPRIKQCI